MTTWTVAAAIAASLLMASCTAQQPDEHTQRRPQQAGQPMDPLRTASHIAGARVDAITGDQAGVHRNMDAMSEDLRRAMKLADASRPIDREAARGVARAMPGVRSANWIDRHNLLVRVDGAHLRSQQTIDELCVRLEPLGDTLAVVVQLQDAAPATRDGMDTLGRNCQLAPGDHALLQRARTVDALDPAIRAQQRADAERMARKPQHEQTAGDRQALERMPEM
jgi:hypothetical protein